MSTAQLVSVEDVHDFVRGTNFFSASGGGEPETTVHVLGDDLKRDLGLGWIDLRELPDNSLVVCANFSGSIAPTDGQASMETEFRVHQTVDRPLVRAVRELEAFLGEPVGAIISIELGGINTGHALDAAANLSLPIVDADYAGRAIPESNCITPNLYGKPTFPRVLVDFYGDVLFMKNAQNNRMVERLGKFISTAAFGIVGVASIPLRGYEVKQIAIPGTLSECLGIGRTIRRARNEGRNPVEATVTSLANAWDLFRGRISHRWWESRDGYMWGEHTVEGEGRFSGHELRIWFKNENHMTWLDGTPHVCSPDIIEVVDGETAEPLVNSSLEEGQRIAVIGVKRRDQFDNDKGLEVLGPRHWGFDVQYRPIEALV